MELKHTKILSLEVKFQRKLFCKPEAFHKGGTKKLILILEIFLSLSLQ